MPDAGGRPHQERRDTSPAGLARRARFEASLALLRSLGLSPRAVEHYRQRARETHRLPHELVRDVAEAAARPRGRAAPRSARSRHRAARASPSTPAPALADMAALRALLTLKGV